MRPSRIAAVTLVVALAVAVVGAAPAVASTQKFPTKVTIHFVAGSSYSADKFKGKVKSQKAVCRKHRKVTVFRKKAGPDVKYGTDFTNKKGNYLVTKGDASHARSGQYYSKAKKKVKKKANGNKIVCIHGKSKTITVP
jgi:hypothetical protein